MDNYGAWNYRNIKNGLNEMGVTQITSATCNLELNGLLERLNMNLTGKEIVMLKETTVPERFWVEEILQAALLHNCTK